MAFLNAAMPTPFRQLFYSLFPLRPFLLKPLVSKTTVITVQLNEAIGQNPYILHDNLRLLFPLRGSHFLLPLRRPLGIAKCSLQDLGEGDPHWTEGDGKSRAASLSIVIPGIRCPCLSSLCPCFTSWKFLHFDGCRAVTQFVQPSAILLPDENPPAERCHGRAGSCGQYRHAWDFQMHCLPLDSPAARCLSELQAIHVKKLMIIGISMSHRSTRNRSFWGLMELCIALIRSESSCKYSHNGFQRNMPQMLAGLQCRLRPEVPDLCLARPSALENPPSCRVPIWIPCILPWSSTGKCFVIHDDSWFCIFLILQISSICWGSTKLSTTSCWWGLQRNCYQIDPRSTDFYVACRLEPSWRALLVCDSLNLEDNGKLEVFRSCFFF